MTLRRRLKQAFRPGVLLGVALALAGCGHQGTSAAPAPNLVFRDANGTEVARAWMQLPARLPGPAKTFGGSFRLISSRGDFSMLSSDRYTAFVGQGGDAITANLNPDVADRNVTLSGKVGVDEVRGTWALSTFGGVRPKGTFVLGWTRK